MFYVPLNEVSRVDIKKSRNVYKKNRKAGYIVQKEAVARIQTTNSLK